MTTLSKPCVFWPGAVTSKGYGTTTQDGATVAVHRLAYEQNVGSIPAGYVVDHLCHNADPDCPGGNTCLHRRCINPEHLEVVTRAENNRRGRVNLLKTHCRYGHPFDAENTYVSKSGLSRSCRTCDAARHRARYLQRRQAAMD